MLDYICQIWLSIDKARSSSHPVMTDHQKSSLSWSVAERKSSYPLRIHHHEAGVSTSPIKKTRTYNSEYSLKGQRHLEHSNILTRSSPSAPYPISGVEGVGRAPAESAGRREVQPSDNEATLLHGRNTASEFSPQPMDVDFRSRGWENEGEISVANEGSNYCLMNQMRCMQKQ